MDSLPPVTAAGDALVTEAPPPSRPIPTVPSPGSEERPVVAPERPASASVPPTSVRDPARTSAVLNELTLARRDLAERVAEHRKMASERNALRARLGQAQAKVEELSSALRAEAKLRSDLADAQAGTIATLRSRVAELENHGSSGAEHERRIAELEQRLAAREAELAEREAELLRLKAEPTASSKSGGEKTGLRAIRGVGPAYERALIALGITEVAQIADWTPERAAEIAPKIKARIDRMMRDDWIGQARRLCGRA